MANSTRKVDVEREPIESEPSAAAAETELGLDENVAGALAYMFSFISGLLFYLLEKENEFVRFHAAQSIAFSGLLFVTYIGLSVVGTVLTTILFTSTSTFLVGSLLSLVLGLAWLVVALGGFAVWIYLMVKAYQGETPRIPVAAGIADKML